MTLTNKTAIVTGATGNGMGRSIALTLAREGANVVINYRQNKAHAEKIVEYINNIQKVNAIAVKADIFNDKECRELVNTTVKQFGSVDILVINPGANWNIQSIDNLNFENSLIDIKNEISPIYYFFPKVLPIMYRQKWGRIIGISMTSNPPSPSYSYNVAKQARTNALLSASLEAWKNNVTINVVSPGPVEHIDQLDKAIDLVNNNDEWINRKNISPQDIAETVIFLCSNKADYVTGTEINLSFK
ncbi:MAG TPA: SDR family oxidoreductase [Draconibacterium sp.]|nr:SDR family oxidoreductase [Draconibacterium sp.]